MNYPRSIDEVLNSPVIFRRETVAALKNLKLLDISQTKVSQRGVARLKKALSRCEIKSIF